MSKEAREGLCQRCECEYPGWFAPNPLWNATIRRDGTDEFAFLCPTCFAQLAEERGVKTGAWAFTDQTDGHTQAAELAYAVREIAIQAAEAHERYRLGQLPAPERTAKTALAGWSYCADGRHRERAEVGVSASEPERQGQ